MNDGLLALIEREVLDWPGVSKETHRGSRGGFWVPPATVYKFGRRALGPSTTPAWRTSCSRGRFTTS